MKKAHQAMRKISDFEVRLGEKPLLISVRRGLTLMIPLILICSVALVFISLPIPAYQNFMKAVFGAEWKNVFVYIRDGTFSILSLIMVICISYSYTAEYSKRSKRNISPIIASVVSLSSYVALFGISKKSFRLADFGVSCAFIAIFVAITSSALFLKLSSIKILKTKIFTDGDNTVFSEALSAICPAAITIAAYAIFNQLLSSVWGASDIQSILSNFLCGVFYKINSPFWSAILFVFLTHIMWFFGMHGNNILDPVAQNIFVPAVTVNQDIIKAGDAPTQIFTQTFFNTFVLMGGRGAALCLIFAILTTGKHKSQHRIARLSLVPVLFNINELIIFGIPIVLNPVYLIPFVLVPIILTITSYLATLWGLVPYTRDIVEWTTPIFLSGYAATDSISGSVLQLFNLALGVLCYRPFVKLARKISNIQMKNSINKVYAAFKQAEERGVACAFLTRQDEIGAISRALIADLKDDLQKNKLALFYQPQVDYEGTVFGCEALLRWNHKSYGYLYPPLIIALAEEAQLIDKLGYWILDMACRDLKQMNTIGLEHISVSVNISAVQLENVNFIEYLREIILRHKINPSSLKIEITEQAALASCEKIIDQIMSIKKLGIKLEMDDFGMGHSSLMYLKEYHFDAIKLDGSLVREICSNANCGNIISSIVYLSKSLNYSILAEYVEDEAQRSILHELGCDKYQGYLYSKAIPYEDFIEYVQELKAEHMSAEEPAVNLPSVPYIAIGKSGAITFQKYD